MSMSGYTRMSGRRCWRPSTTVTSGIIPFSAWRTCCLPTTNTLATTTRRIWPGWPPTRRRGSGGASPTPCKCPSRRPSQENGGRPSRKCFTSTEGSLAAVRRDGDRLTARFSGGYALRLQHGLCHHWEERLVEHLLNLSHGDETHL